MATHLAGVAVLVALVVGWVAVQRAWARVFEDEASGPDALAGRGGCAGAGCAAACQERPCAGGSGRAEGSR